MSSPAKGKPILLYVGDEEHNQNSFIAIFRRNYTVLSSGSAQEALKILETEPVEIIICEKKIRSVTGVDFLASTIANHNHCIRLLVSDYANLDHENRAQIFDYIIQPWDEEQISKIINQAHQEFMLNRS
jgi:DNA-binding NtrC family response regulator